MPQPSGPSWRGSADPPGRGAVRSWRKPASGGATSWPLRSRWLRGFMSFLSALIALAAISMFIVLIFVPGCAQTRYAVLGPAPYSDGGLPPHPFAQQDRESFRTQFAAEGLPELEEQNSSSAAAKARSGNPGSSRSVLVLYVVALAGRNESGVVLYSVDSGPDEPEGYLPLDRLWDYLARLPREQKKLLAIDLSRGPIDWRWGQFARPEFAPNHANQEALASTTVALSKIPNLAILTSAAPGEVSWTSPSLARSVFGHFLIRAIAGEADGSGGVRDRRITLAEINHYVQTHTNHWVSQNRDLRGQHPQLLMAEDSRQNLLGTVVSEVRGTVAPPSQASKPIDGVRLKQLETLWETRELWSTREPEQWCPLGWRQLNEHLRRAEQWWLAGQTEGMDPHLQAAEKAARDLETQNTRRNTEQTGYRFVTTNLSRRTGTVQLTETEPLLPERQLQAAFQGFGPASLPKPMQEASVRLRAKAELQSWQSYQSHLWTGSLLAEVDRDRRLAEDLLFVGGEVELDRSATLRQTAETKLDQRDQIIRELTEAHRLHHRLLAELPDLAWWAAQRLPVENLRSKAVDSRRARLMKEYSLGIDEARFRPPALSEQEKLRGESDDSSLQQTEIDLLVLFELTRQLARLIDHELEGTSSFVTATEWMDELKALKQGLTHPQQGLDAIRNRLIRHAKDLIGATNSETSGSTDSELGQTQYFHWLRLRNAFYWSGLPAETRRGLLTDLEQSDRILHANAQKVPVATSAEWNGDDWAGVDGCWQALWALQSLSLGSSNTAMHERWVVWKNAVVDSKKQLELLVQLGQNVRREYRDRVDRAQPTPASADRLPDVLRSLIAADRATRTLHGYDAALFPIERDPSRRLREFDLGALCITQADRYLEDFWGKVNAGDREFWFVQSADQCLKFAGVQYDALSITALKSARDDVFRRLQARQSAQLKISSAEGTVDLGLVTQRPVKITTESTDQVPSGVAALWLFEDVDPADAILDFLPQGRRGISTSSTAAELMIRKRQTPPAAKCAEISVRPRLLFRARYWDQQDNVVRVNPCPPNSIDCDYQYPAANGEIVVNGVDRRDTIFILDCSLSMGDPMDPKNKQGDSRFQAARKALSDAIRVLRDAPVLRNEKEPHVVGLMAYGHRARTKGGDLNQTATNPNWRFPIPAAVSGDWRNDYELLIPPARLVDEQYQRIEANLENLQPFGQTPLLGAILSSARSLIERKRGGVIVAITDGAYNDGTRDGPLYKSVQDLLRGHPELSLHIVAFGVDELSEIASLKKLGEHTRGTYHDAPDGTRLAEAIEKVMRPRQYTVIREEQPREEMFANLGDPIGGRPPHAYKVRFPDCADFPVTILGGERLEFDLDFASHRLKHRRLQPQLFRRIQDAVTRGPREPTRFGYLQADYDKPTRRAEFLFSLDRDDLLGMIDRPAEIRIDIAPNGVRRRFSRSSKLAPNQSTPVWRIELRDWPADNKPEVQASWRMSRTEPDAQVSYASLKKSGKPLALPQWPENSLIVSTEQQPGKVLIKLRADGNASEVDVADIRVEIGQQSQVESRFLPEPFNWRSKLFENQREVTYEFDVGETFDAEKSHIAFTSRASLDRGTVTLESPLVIDKWDKEQ